MEVVLHNFKQKDLQFAVRAAIALGVVGVALKFNWMFGQEMNKTELQTAVEMYEQRYKNDDAEFRANMEHLQNQVLASKQKKEEAQKPNPCADCDHDVELCKTCPAIHPDEVIVLDESSPIEQAFLEKERLLQRQIAARKAERKAEQVEEEVEKKCC